MEIKTTSIYTPDLSEQRIKDILNSAEKFDELDYIPAREELTYSNGFYVYCTAVFIDIRDSSNLPNIHTKSVMGKIYRAYISECVALIKKNSDCREIFINGDCVSGIFDTVNKSNIDSAFEIAFSLNSLIKMLNWRLEKKGYTPITCGIGMSYGRALMMKAGYSGSGINDVIWLGDVVNEASNLCHQGNKGNRKSIQVANLAFNNLNDYNQSLLHPILDGNFVIMNYEGDIINKDMEDWLDKKQKNTDAIDIFGALSRKSLLGI